MTPSDVKGMDNIDILEMLTNLHPSDQAVSWLAALIADPVAIEGVNELRRRYAPEMTLPTTPTGRVASAHSVAISTERFRAFFHRRRMALVDIGPSMEPPRCEAWGSIALNRQKVGFYAMDDLACALGLHVDQLIHEVGTDDERARLSVCV